MGACVVCVPLSILYNVSWRKDHLPLHIHLHIRQKIFLTVLGAHTTCQEATSSTVNTANI